MMARSSHIIVSLFVWNFRFLVITINILALLMIYEFVKFTVEVHNVLSEWSLNSFLLLFFIL